jgi:HK97 family phage prohead protease
MQRVFNALTIRTLDSEQRLIEGWATTPRSDRMGDIVEPLGAEFDLPIPFLLDHDHTLAVGEVEKAEVTSKGIRFVARIKKIPEPGAAKDLVDKAWHLLKHGLRRTVSIGFQPHEYEPLPTGGLRFKVWSWLELSAVSVPANADARVDGIKRASNHSKRRGVVRLSSNGAAGLPVVKVGPAGKKTLPVVKIKRSLPVVKIGTGKIRRHSQW